MYEALLNHISNSKLDFNSVDKLRSFALDLAMRGKLAPQDSQEIPAHEILKEIKKDNQFQFLDSDELPYEVPDGWEWYRFGSVLDIKGGSQPPKSTFSNEPGPGLIRLIQIRDLGKNPVPVYIPEELAKNRCMDTDIMLARYGASIGKVFWGQQGSYNVALTKIIFEKTAIEPEFLFYLLKSKLFQDHLTKSSRMAQAGFNKGNLNSIPLPMPPFAEQGRIVAELKKVLHLLDNLEKTIKEKNGVLKNLRKALLLNVVENNSESIKTSINQLVQYSNQLFSYPSDVEYLRRIILQFALQGRLSPQNDNDEPASSLIKKIAGIKKQLILNKEIRKPKTLRPIEPHEIPFTIPKNWEWCRFEALHRKLGAGSTPRGGKEAYTETGIKFLRSQNVYNDGLRLNGIALIPHETHNRMKNTIVKPNDILLNITGGSIGRSAVVPVDFDEANVNQHVAIVRQILPSMNKWVHLFLTSPFGYDMIMSVQVGISREGLSMQKLREFLIPIPPLSEIHRIVEKVEELMMLCDSLEDCMISQQNTLPLITGSLIYEIMEAIQ